MSVSDRGSGFAPRPVASAITNAEVDRSVLAEKSQWFAGLPMAARVSLCTYMDEMILRWHCT